MNNATFQNIARSVPIGRIGWFDLLDNSGAIQRWLSARDIEKYNYALLLFSHRSVIAERGSRIAHFLRPIIQSLIEGRDDPDRKRSIKRYFSFETFHRSNELFDLFLHSLIGGLFNDVKSGWWTQFHGLAEKRPKSAVKLISAVMDAYLRGSGEALISNIEKIELPEKFVSQAARSAPEDMVREILPRAIALMKTNPQVTEEGEVRDEIWPWLTLGVIYDFRWALLEGLREAMTLLAKSSPEQLNEQTIELRGMQNLNASYLLLSAWCENPHIYSDAIIDYLTQDIHRLNLGFGIWGSGNGKAAITRKAISVASKHCSDTNIRKLDKVVLDFYPENQEDDSENRGYCQLLLLHAIDARRLSDASAAKLKALTDTFPKTDFSEATESAAAHFVGPPISAEKTRTMTDDEWRNAMNDFRADRISRTANDGLILGGAVELSRQLEIEVANNKPRFASVVMTLGAEVPLVYFEAILRGLVARHKENQGISARGKPTLPELESETLFPVFRHIHQLPGHPGGRWLCSAIANVADRDLPDDILEIVCYYASNGHDPKEVAEDSTKHFGGDLVTYGINTTRGAAVDTLAYLLFADSSRWPKIQAGILCGAQDPSWAVRAVGIHCLTALLNVDRDRAVELFLLMTAGTPQVLGSLYVGEFLNRAVQSHYLSLRRLLIDMLANADDDVRKVASLAIALARFGNSDAESDLQKVLSGDEICRAQVALVAAENLRMPAIQHICRKDLIIAFSDSSRMVQDTAARCFHAITADQLCSEPELIDAFISSPAFSENAYNLLSQLKEAVHRLPDVICKIPEKAIALRREMGPDQEVNLVWWSNEMAGLVLRLYEQTSDLSIRSRCLDVLDGMIDLGFGDVSEELEKLERA